MKIVVHGLWHEMRCVALGYGCWYGTLRTSVRYTRAFARLELEPPLKWNLSPVRATVPTVKATHDATTQLDIMGVRPAGTQTRAQNGPLSGCSHEDIAEPQCAQRLTF